MKTILISCLTAIISICIQLMPGYAETIIRADEEWPPYTFVEDGNPAGLTVELMEAMLRKIPGMSVEYEFYPWARALHTVKTEPNRFAFFTRSEKREPNFKWVGPILPRNMSFFGLKSRPDIRVSALKDMIPHVIGVKRGSRVIDDLRNSGVPQKHIEEVRATDLNIKKLFRGRIDIAAENELVFRHRVKEEGFHNREVKKLFTIQEASDYYFGFNKSTDDTLIRKLQQSFETIRQDGIYDTVVKKYYQ